MAETPISPEEWRERLQGCQFWRASNLIREMLGTQSREAKQRGDVMYVTPSFLSAVETFIGAPSSETAVPLLTISPPLWSYFEGCLPGGLFTLTNR
jgi:hypothetical protein